MLIISSRKGLHSPRLLSASILMVLMTNYQKIRPLTIELYTDNKDFTLEATVEGILSSNGLTYARSESWIDSERMNMVAYTMSVVITG